MWSWKREETSCARGRYRPVPDIALFEAETGAAKEAARRLARRKDTGSVTLVTDSESLERAQEEESKEGRLEERPVGTETGELDHEASVGPGGNERADEEARRGGRIEQEGVIWSRGCGRGRLHGGWNILPSVPVAAK